MPGDRRRAFGLGRLMDSEGQERGLGATSKSFSEL